MSFFYQDLFLSLSSIQDVMAKWLLVFITQNTIGLICLVLLIHTFILKTSHHSLFGAWCVNIIGVLFHELAHAIVGFVLGAKPNKFVVIPSSINNGDGRKVYVLGHIECLNLRWYNAFPVALAPVLLLFVAYGIEKYYWSFAPAQTLSYELFYVYLLVTFILNAMPSSIDFEEGFENILGVILWVGVIAVFWKGLSAI